MRTAILSTITDAYTTEFPDLFVSVQILGRVASKCNSTCQHLSFCWHIRQLIKAFHLNDTATNHQTVEDKNNGSLARTKRNSGPKGSKVGGELGIFSKFKSDLPTGSKNETSKNSTKLTEEALKRLDFIKAAKFVPFPKPDTLSYFVVQMIVLGTRYKS